MTEEERQEIITWICENFFQLLISNDVHKLDHIFSIYDKTVPMAVWRIKNRIIHKEKLQKYMSEHIGQDMLLLHIQGGNTKKHKDSNIDNHYHIRYNVGVNIPQKTAKAVYNAEEVDLKTGNYVMCRSGLDFHLVEENTDPFPRIVISYGFYIPKANLTGHTVINDISTSDSIPLKRDVYFYRKEKRTDEWPSPISILNTHLFFVFNNTSYYGLKWWSKGERSVETLRDYVERGKRD